MNPEDDVAARMSQMLSLEDVAAIFTHDLPTLTDAQLAQVLAEVRRCGQSPLTAVIEPIARAELARRRRLPPVKAVPADQAGGGMLA